MTAAGDRTSTSADHRIRLPGRPAAAETAAVLIRRETAGDTEAIEAGTTAAFGRADRPGPVVEAVLVRELRASDAWIPALSFVAEAAGEIVGHVVCTRAHVDGAPVLGLGPLSVRPDRQRAGFGAALMHAVLGAADALGEPLVGLLGDPAYYGRFGFRAATLYGILPPVPRWADHFQVRPLTAYDPSVRGTFAYAEPFDRT